MVDLFRSIDLWFVRSERMLYAFTEPESPCTDPFENKMYRHDDRSISTRETEFVLARPETRKEFPEKHQHDRDACDLGKQDQQETGP
jgi:hypothetical protein